MFLEEISLKIRKNKTAYYIKNYFRRLIPTWIYKNSLNNKLKAVHKYDKNDILERVDYYNKLNHLTYLDDRAIPIMNLFSIKKAKAYHFDTYEYTRYFKQKLKGSFLFGDITTVEDIPSIQKSRPIDGDNSNAILLKLDKKRHFLFIKDQRLFSEKKDILIGRGAIKQAHRIRFMEMYFNHPLCDLGMVNKNEKYREWHKPKISILAHLDYKFILSLEGNDVATNLKWIMSSNSIAVMPKPKYETWFMEGRLIPNFHYILIKDDYSDLEERLQYYISNTQEAQAIIDNAHQYVNQFLNPEKEDLISLLVLQKYFYYTSQTDKLIRLEENI